MDSYANVVYYTLYQHQMLLLTWSNNAGDKVETPFASYVFSQLSPYLVLFITLEETICRIAYSPDI